MTASEGLSTSAVVDLLAELGRRLEVRGETAELYLAGGAAMLLRYGRLTVTRDVDVAAVSAVVAREAHDIAVERGLAPDWLSSGMGPWAPGPDAGDELRRLGGLVVRIAGPRPMLAMKLAAGRGRDVEDIRRLCRVLGITSAEDAVRVAVDVYGPESEALGDADDVAAFARAVLGDVGGGQLPDATERAETRCGRTVSATGTPCRLSRGHAGRCRSSVPRSSTSTTEP